jgi:hypothetical protein
MSSFYSTKPLQFPTFIPKELASPAEAKLYVVE